MNNVNFRLQLIIYIFSSIIDSKYSVLTDMHSILLFSWYSWWTLFLLDTNCVYHPNNINPLSITSSTMSNFLFSYTALCCDHNCYDSFLSDNSKYSTHYYSIKYDHFLLLKCNNNSNIVYFLLFLYNVSTLVIIVVYKLNLFLTLLLI